jgi:ABC-type proline/glycine betaine transport system ATPase subunit
MIEINNISKKIKGEVILKNINLKLYEGKVLVFRVETGPAKPCFLGQFQDL